jgi:hypothetical protein
MPPVRQPKFSSTQRRKQLGSFINLFGDVMPRACSSCRRSGKECKVHVRSGRCGACHLSGSLCDIRVTKSEWDRLRSERERLLKEIERSLEAQKEARRALEKAAENELRLRREMSSLEHQAEEAIAVEEANLGVLERGNEVLDLPLDEGLALSPHTWSAEAGLSDDFWAPSLSTPWVLSAGGTPPLVQG